MKALVLSGGGAKGAYQVGALRYLLSELQNTYDILCGVSVGAINCAFVAQFESGKEQEAGQNLSDLWSNLNTESIYTRWFPFGKFHSLWRSSFYDSSPLHRLIKSNISLEKVREVGKKVSVGAVSLNAGKYTIFNQDHDHFLEAVLASASFPGMLTPVEIDGQLWTDGGVKEISPIKTAIDLGATEIDIIVTSPEVRTRKFIEHPTTVDILKRTIDLSTDKIMSNDIEKLLMYNKLAMAGLLDRKFINMNIIRPDHNLTEDLLDFNPDKLKEMMICGYNDVKKKYIANITA